MIRVFNINTNPGSMRVVAGKSAAGDSDGTGSIARFRFQTTQSNLSNMFAINKNTGTIYVVENGTVNRIRSLKFTASATISEASVPMLTNVCRSDIVT
jgi:hypothetical protein